jgi:MraZ protein
MDSKGRVSIPPGYRVELQSRSDQAPFLTTADRCLALYAHEEWLKYEDRLAGLNVFDPNAEALGRLMLSGANPAPIDAQGRILVPPAYREHAGLEREVMVAGVGHRVELWDKGRFEAELQKTQVRYFEISSALSKLGM